MSLHGKIAIKCPKCKKIHLQEARIQSFTCSCGELIFSPLRAQLSGKNNHGRESKRRTVVLPLHMEEALISAAHKNGTTPSHLIRAALSSLLHVPE